MNSRSDEKPRNGLAGIKHWRYDLSAGLQVALVSMPLSLGIAVASGAPPITGIVSAIIAGLIFPFLGGAYVTISGPAAGLAPALLAGMLTLGNGDLAAGYPLLLVAIFLTGLVQIVLSLVNAGRFAIFLPVTVESLLATLRSGDGLRQDPSVLAMGTLGPTLEPAEWQDLEFGEADRAEARFSVATAEGVGLLVSIGWLGAVMRAGSLSAVLLSSLPLWQRMDPLAVLSVSEEERRRREQELRDARDTEDRVEREVGRLLEPAGDR